jgi:N-acetylglucosaminyldiphosphoundecaprenol N-acetyl-beta-D-mannosaminyltransferase
MATRDLFGVPVAALTMDEALSLVEEAIASRRRLQIGVVNAAKLVVIRRNEELRRDVLSSDLILADGAAVVWASRILGRPLPERVAGIDLMHGMLALGSARGFRVYCLGAKPEVLDRAIRRIASEYPGVTIAGSHHGYFPREGEQAVFDDIARAKPDILLIGITSPAKERFLARWSPRLDVPVSHGVGGSFDVLGGVVSRAPLLWQRLGLEWLYRVVQEPRRLAGRYLKTNVAFILMLGGAWWRQLRGRTDARPQHTGA